VSTSNPYLSPSALPPTEIRPAATTNWKRWAWLTPLAGLGLSVALNTVSSGLGEIGSMVGALGGLIFMASIALGWILTGIVLIGLIVGRGGLRSLIAGVITNGLLTLLVVVSFHAVGLARQAAIESRRREQARQREIEASDEVSVQPSEDAGVK
jgi:hypothetical protein